MTPLRPEQGAPAVLTLKLNEKCNSRLGLLLKRHSGERGSVHSWRDAKGAPVKVRFHTKGSGRHKRFYVTPV